MRIAHVGTSTGPLLGVEGGALQRRIVEMAVRQAAGGHEVHAFSPGDRDEVVHHHGVTIHFVRLRSRRPARDFEFLAKARRRANRLPRLDVLHAHGSPHAGAFLASRAHRAVHSVDYFEYGLTRYRLGRRYIEWALAKYDLNLPVSEFCADAFTAFYPDQAPRVRVLYNGVDVDAFHADQDGAVRARAALGLPDGPLVVYLGRVCEQKGSDLLCGLAEGLRASHPEARVVASGPTEQFGSFEHTSLVAALERSGVVCTGPVHEQHLRGLLNAATVFVLPTRRDEMFGMAALEAASCGTPVVASDLGGIPEAVGQGGLLFPVGDGDALGQRVRQLLDDPEQRAAVGARAREHATAFTWEAIVDHAGDLYRAAAVTT